MKKIAFDVDGTLIKKDAHNEDIPRYEVLDILRSLKKLGCEIFVWSGSGYDYARRWSEKLGIAGDVTILPKSEYHDIDLSFDDEDIDLAAVNIKV